MCEYSEPGSQSCGQAMNRDGREGVPLRSFPRTSGSGVTPNGLYLKSPKLLVFSSTPIHRASPKESVTSADPITRRNRVDSIGVSAWCLVVIGVTVPSVPHILTLVSLLWSSMSASDARRKPETTHPTWATVRARYSAAKNGGAGLSRVWSRAMDAVAPEAHASFSPDRLRSTYAHIAIKYRLRGTATHLEKCRGSPRLQVKYRLAVRILQPREQR